PDRRAILGRSASRPPCPPRARAAPRGRQTLGKRAPRNRGGFHPCKARVLREVAGALLKAHARAQLEGPRRSGEAVGLELDGVPGAEEVVGSSEVCVVEQVEHLGGNAELAIAAEV